MPMYTEVGDNLLGGTMNDLISRQAAIDALNGEIEVTGRTNAEAVKGYVRLVKDRLERLPSADAVEVVRCKDCKWSHPYQCAFVRTYIRKDDYCSRGERKDFKG